MAKTYTLTGTGYGGGQGSWSSHYWTNMYSISGRNCGRGDNNRYWATSYVFDASTLASLRTKTATSIKLTITVVSGRVYHNQSALYSIAYKWTSGTSASSSSNHWARSDADSTAASTTYVTILRNNSISSGYTSCSNTSFTFDITGSKVPVYGYVIGPEAGYNLGTNTYITLGATCTLVVVTNETDTKVWINVNGTWKLAIPWINVNGTWKKATAWINVGGTWKKCQ